MKIIITAGPTREYIDPVRFITNASSGKMGYAIAAAATAAGHQVTLISGPVCLPCPQGVARVDIVSVDDLRRALDSAFSACDALIMTAAVGDFSVADYFPAKISRKSGPMTIRLIPTPDVLACVAAGKRPSQIVVAFAVESGTPAEAQAKALAEMRAKNADYVVVNTPAAMSADASQAAILSPGGVILPWASRPKHELAKAIIAMLAAGSR